jgi:hypothetical protein
MGRYCDKSEKTRLALFARKSSFTEKIQWSQIFQIFKRSN